MNARHPRCLYAGARENLTMISARLARLSLDELVRLFDEHADDGEEMMKWADRMARHAGNEGLTGCLAEAIGRIAARSPMRTDGLRGRGGLVPPAEPAAWTGGSEPIPLTSHGMVAARRQGEWRTQVGERVSGA